VAGGHRQRPIAPTTASAHVPDIVGQLGASRRTEAGIARRDGIA
jgi:hypothetical protein